MSFEKTSVSLWNYFCGGWLVLHKKMLIGNNCTFLFLFFFLIPNVEYASVYGLLWGKKLIKLPRENIVIFIWMLNAIVILEILWDINFTYPSLCYFNLVFLFIVSLIVLILHHIFYKNIFLITLADYRNSFLIKFHRCHFLV